MVPLRPVNEGHEAVTKVPGQFLEIHGSLYNNWKCHGTINLLRITDAGDLLTRWAFIRQGRLGPVLPVSCHTGRTIIRIYGQGSIGPGAPGWRPFRGVVPGTRPTPRPGRIWTGKDPQIEPDGPWHYRTPGHRRQDSCRAAPAGSFGDTKGCDDPCY